MSAAAPRRSARLAAPPPSPVAATAAATAPPPILPAYAPAGITKPTGCFYVYPKSGLQCRFKPEPHDCVCYHHVSNRPTGAPLPCPPGHTLHPEPVGIPRALRLLVAEKATQLYDHSKSGHDWTTLRDSPLGDEIQDYVRQIHSLNPDLSDPTVLRYSHDSHRRLWYIVVAANHLARAMADWKSGELGQDDAVPRIKQFALAVSMSFSLWTDCDV